MVKVNITDFSEEGYDVIEPILTEYYQDKFPVEGFKDGNLIYFRGTWCPETFFVIHLLKIQLPTRI